MSSRNECYALDAGNGRQICGIIVHGLPFGGDAQRKSIAVWLWRHKVFMVTDTLTDRVIVPSLLVWM